MATCVKCGKKGLLLKVNSHGLCETCADQEIATLRREVQELATPEYQDLEAIKQRIEQNTTFHQQLIQQIASANAQIRSQEAQLAKLKKQLLVIDDDILVQEFGLYKPRYKFANSTKYKERLEKIREKQKSMIKDNTATLAVDGWTVNNSKSEGKKMVNDMRKLLLRAYNNECEDVIEKVKYSNYDASVKRIKASETAISKIGKIMHISISSGYAKLKLEELQLAFEYQQIKQQEKEEQKALRAQMREEEKLQREIEAERKKVEKEQNHYLNALAKINAQIESANEADKADLLVKKQDLENKVADAEKALKDIDYREANKRAGYVYVVSNIGSFGENVYKIGMTRRLDPTERIDELGDASVPFDFDVHAMIFSDDAPALETALHHAFEDKKLNMVNHRREFFNVTLDEIKQEIQKNYDKTVEFIDVPEAEQYRVSLKMKNN